MTGNRNLTERQTLRNRLKRVISDNGNMIALAGATMAGNTRLADQICQDMREKRC